jgi:hypothetical protein
MMPPDVPKEAVLVYAEIAMMAEMNFIDGYFRVEAALAPTSYLLVPQCKIYGGFAMCYWFPVSWSIFSSYVFPVLTNGHPA